MDNANNANDVAACTTCFKTLTGNWALHPKGECKTGRLTAMNGFILSESPNWISCYCESCWKDKKEEEKTMFEELTASLCVDQEEKAKEIRTLKENSERFVAEIQRLTEKNQMIESELNRKIEILAQKRVSLEQDNANLNSMVQVLDTQKTSLADNYAELQDKLRDSKNENENLNLRIQELLQDKQTKDQELESYQKKAEDAAQERDLLKQERELFESQNDDLRRTLNVMKNEREAYELQNQTLLQEKQIIEDELKGFREQVNNLTQENMLLLEEKEKLNSQSEQLDIQLKSLRDASKDFESEKNVLKTQLDELKSKIQQSFIFKDKRIDPENFKDFYDCRIIADSFYTMLNNKSWSIEYNDFKKYLDLKTQNTTKVAALGYENTGKSFVISKLTGSELPQGLFMKTVGVCLKFPTGKHLPWTALDTPGTNISIKTEEMKKHLAEYFEAKGFSNAERVRMLLGDNILMENLLQEFAVKHAQVLLVVIGKLRRDDQRLVNRIKKLPGKRIIIVHNLSDAHSKEDVEEIIKEDIQNTFAVTEKTIYLEQIEAGKREEMNQKVYLENEIVGEKAIEHIVMAHEGSPAGKYYNDSAITYIKTLITSVPHNQSFDLTQAFLTHLNENLNTYLHSKTPKCENPFILEKDEKGTPKAIKLNDCLQYDLKLSSADEFGQIRTFAREGLDNISYTVKIIDEKTDDGVEKILKVDLELVGHYEEKIIKPKVYQSNDQISIEITGKSEDNTMKSEKCNILENTRKFGDFSILTDPINLDGLCISRLEGCKKSKNQVPGILTLAWNLYKPAE